MLEGQQYKSRVEGLHVRWGRGPFVDGDTILLKRLLAKDQKRDWEVVENGLWLRLLEVDTPERGQAGFWEASEFTERWILDRMVSEWPFTLTAVYRDSFGRWLSYVKDLVSGEYLHEALIDAGHSERISPYEQLENVPITAEQLEELQAA